MKIESWQSFVTRQGNEKPWGFVYYQQTEKLRMEKVISTPRSGAYSTSSVEETAKYLINIRIPDDREEEDTLEQREIRYRSLEVSNTADASFFSASEVAVAIRSFQNDKAPGLDLIETRVLKVVSGITPGQLIKLFNSCLQ